MWGNWYTKIITGQTEQALAIANELVAVAEELADPDLLLEAYHSRWANSHVLGLNSNTLADAERGIQLYDPERHHAHAYDYGGHDTGVCAYAHSAITLWVMGFPEKAAQMSVSGLSWGIDCAILQASRTPHGGQPRFGSSFVPRSRVANTQN